jgi:hypothetical protein
VPGGCVSAKPAAANPDVHLAVRIEAASQGLSLAVALVILLALLALALVLLPREDGGPSSGSSAVALAVPAA